MKGPVLTSASLGAPVFQEIITTAQGGFVLDETVFPAGTILKAGTVVGYDESTRKAKVLKGGVLQASATNVDTTYKVLKGSNILVGMSLNLPGGTARAITAIDNSNASYDLLTVATTIGVAAAAGIMIAVTDIGSTSPDGLLLFDTEVDTANTEVAVVLRGVVYHRRIPPIPASIAALLPNVILSESY